VNSLFSFYYYYNSTKKKNKKFICYISHLDRCQDECLHCSIRSLFDVVRRPPFSFFSLGETTNCISRLILLLVNVPCRSFYIHMQTNRREKASFEYNEYAVGRALAHLRVTTSLSVCLY